MLFVVVEDMFVVDGSGNMLIGREVAFVGEFFVLIGDIAEVIV